MSLALAGCSTVKPEAPPPAPAPSPIPAPTVAEPTGNWADWPIAPGTWAYRQDDRGSLALFGPANKDATFIIRCDRQRKTLFLSRAGMVGNGAKMTLRASTGLQSYTASNNGDVPPYAAIMVQPGDKMMDNIAFSRGRFAVETTGLPSIAIPSWPEFTRVVEDCRA